ncbi:hypothetical protein SRCM100623_00329 [Acetobacter pasteurianus]|uniref:Uncharacterized protein n=1 Tax=Acetobacter pasteurianus TaxID=438 RepID=A0A1A0DMN1_ACEPA|nr:hypothetical protein SRCM100623_02694 [Acetobacter pasteurianus]OAZ75937.1 hypothetical protein SRCM100623_00329 [Acetobacter pasteurianus]
MECPRDSDTAPPPRTDGCPPQCRRHSLLDREEDPLSAPTGHRVNYSAASLCLLQKTGKQSAHADTNYNPHVPHSELN